MNSDKPLPVTPAAPAAPRRVSLSPYVNERFPNWEELLSAHDVARLTRRPRWMVLSLALFGRFPREYRFHGRAIGWLRSDVLRWLAKDLRVTQCRAHRGPVARSRNARQALLPLGDPPHSARRRLGAWVDSKNELSAAERAQLAGALHTSTRSPRR